MRVLFVGGPKSGELAEIPDGRSCRVAILRGYPVDPGPIRELEKVEHIEYRETDLHVFALDGLPAAEVELDVVPRYSLESLIETCKALIETAESYAMQTYDRSGVTRRQIDAASAAIAKAEGRS